MRKSCLVGLTIAVGFNFLGNSSQGAGFMVQEVNNLFAQAHAGRAAVVDVSSMFVNPATMGFLTKNEGALQACYVYPKWKFSSGASSTYQGASNGGNPTIQVVLPAMYFVYQASQRFKFGLALTTPFGITNKFAGNWVGRDVALKTAILSVNLNPTIAYKGDNFAVGFGVSFQRTNFVFSRKMNIDAEQFGGEQSNKAFTKIRGKKVAPGFNFGVLFDMCKNMRLGFSYRSRITHNINGHVRFANIPNLGSAQNNAPLFRNSPVKTTLKTPDMLNLSVIYDINPQWTLLGDLMYTHWSVLRKIEFRRTDDNTILSTEVQNWKNTLMPSVGINYKPNQQFVIRAGTAYDQTPTRDKYRTARLPDQSRIWLAAGFDYNMNDDVSFRFAYAHLFFRKASVDNIIPSQEVIIGSRLQGKLKGQTNLASIQINIKC